MKRLLIFAVIVFLAMMPFWSMASQYDQETLSALKAYENNHKLTAAQEKTLKQLGVFDRTSDELDHSGGPDAFGYMFEDSDEVGGPVYAWVDITETGTAITDMGDDDYQGPFALPFTFNFYGNDWDEIYICSNGHLMFGDGDTWFPWQFPDAGWYYNDIAFFADDLNPADGGTIYYGEDDDGNWVCTFEEVHEFSSPGIITCQAILYPNGNILMQYNSMTDMDIAWELIGIQNDDGTIGLMASQDSDPVDYPFEELAILFSLGEEMVILMATPWNVPTWVGPNGGSFLWDAYLENISGGPMMVDAWTALTLPSGLFYEPLRMYAGIPLTEDMILMATPTQDVPGEAPNGIYTFHAKVGDYMAGEVYAEETFQFAKLPLPDAAAAVEFNADGWMLTNFFETDEMGVVEDAIIPTDFSMENAYPNPFNPSTTISLALPENGLMKVSVYNVVGQEVAVLLNGVTTAGYQTLTFDGSNLPSGIYFIHATVPGKMNEIRKVVLMK